MAQICPRCSSKLSFTQEARIGSRIYYGGASRKRKRWGCYLGPRDDQYVIKTRIELVLGRVPITLKGLSG